MSASRQKKIPRRGGVGIDFFPYHVILKIKRGAAGRREPLASYKEVTVKWLNLWRLLLFIVVNMDEQSQNAHDELTDQDQFRMSHHMYHLPPRKRRLYKRSLASSRRRGLPPTEYWQRQRISMRRGYYSTFCRIWQDGGKAPKGGILPSPRTVIARRGKAPTWQSVPPSPKPSPGGRWHGASRDG